VPDQRIVALDGLRGTAIACVMLGHFGPEILSGAGPFGVLLFFALSGRLMSDVLFIGGMNWREFAIRRLARLYPALLFFLGSMFVIAMPLGRTDILSDWWSYPTFSVNLVVILANRFPPFDHLWSVSVEVQAYIALALISVSAPARLRPTVLLGGALFCFGNGLIRTYLLHQNGFLVYWRPDVAAATVFAAAFLRLITKDARLPSWTSPIALTAAAVLMLISAEPWITATVNGLLLALVGATAERSATKARRILESRPLVFLGTISYSLYIWQQLFKYAYESGFPGYIAVPSCLVIAVLSYYRVERPGKAAILAAWHRHGARNKPEMTSQH
jgi:peptidoglycan/LPS O-acetylase OafA/YrhL